MSQPVDREEDLQQKLRFLEDPYFHADEEKFWVDLQPFLASLGYQLRPRYHPSWKPSWRENGKDPENCEDAIVFIKWCLTDAIHVQDGKKVVLKAVERESDEHQIATRLSSSELKSDPHNHSVPILDVIQHPERPELVCLVMPFLRPYYEPEFHCMRELVEALRQWFEGLEFMHRQNCAHRDVSEGNFMMDASRVVPRGSHMVKTTTEDGVDAPLHTHFRCRVAPVRYYIIDFQLSGYFPEGPEAALATGVIGQTRDVPELSETVPYNPFPVDVIQLANAIKNRLSGERFHEVNDFDTLLAAMSSPNPKDRPTAAECLKEFNYIVRSMSRRRLKLRFWLEPPTRLARFIDCFFPNSQAIRVFDPFI